MTITTYDIILLHSVNDVVIHKTSVPGQACALYNNWWPLLSGMHFLDRYITVKTQSTRM